MSVNFTWKNPHSLQAESSFWSSELLPESKRRRSITGISCEEEEYWIGEMGGC